MNLKNGLKKSFQIEQLKLFITAFFQIGMVNMNIIFVTHQMVSYLWVCSFIVSLLWTINVKRAAFGTWKDRFMYALGASVGTLLGYYIASYFVIHSLF